MENWTETLHRRGYRATPQRLAVLHILQMSGQHLSPIEIYERAHSSFPGITEATVYRTLNFLSEQGLVLAAHIGAGQMVYEIAGHNHHHLICRACGATHQIDHSLLEDLYKRFQESTGYEIDSIHVTFFGLCPGCQGEPQLHTAGA